MTPRQLRDAANGPWEGEIKPGDTVTTPDGRELGVVTAVERFCGNCCAGYVFTDDDDFIGRRCACNPRPA